MPTAPATSIEDTLKQLTSISALLRFFDIGLIIDVA